MSVVGTNSSPGNIIDLVSNNSLNNKIVTTNKSLEEIIGSGMDIHETEKVGGTNRDTLGGTINTEDSTHEGTVSSSICNESICNESIAEEDINDIKIIDVQNDNFIKEGKEIETNGTVIEKLSIGEEERIESTNIITSVDQEKKETRANIEKSKASEVIIEKKEIQVDSLQENKTEEKTKGKTSRSVIFSDENEVHEVRKIYNIWLRYSDMEAISIRNSGIAAKINGGYFVEKENVQTRRGLETYVHANLERMWHTRRNTLSAVLGEQTRQKELGINDPQLIADKYDSLGGSSKCLRMAGQMGLQDYEDSKKDIGAVCSQQKDAGSVPAVADKSKSAEKKRSKKSLKKFVKKTMNMMNMFR